MTLALPGRGAQRERGWTKGLPPRLRRPEGRRPGCTLLPQLLAPPPRGRPQLQAERTPGLALIGPRTREDLRCPRGPPRSCCDRKGSQERHEIVFNSDSYLPHYILMDFLPFRGLMETFSPMDKNPK